MTEEANQQDSRSPRTFNIGLFLLCVVLGAGVCVLLGGSIGAEADTLAYWAIGGVVVGVLFGALLATSVKMDSAKNAPEAKPDDEQVDEQQAEDSDTSANSPTV